MNESLRNLTGGVDVTVLSPGGTRCNDGSLTGLFGLLVQSGLAALAFSCLIGELTTNSPYTEGSITL